MVHPYQLFGENLGPSVVFTFTVPNVVPCAFIIRTITWAGSLSQSDGITLTFNTNAQLQFFGLGPTNQATSNALNVYMPLHSGDTIEIVSPAGGNCFIGVYGDWWAPNDDSS